MRNHRRLVAAPISWGICEVPGWGRMLDAERVLGEMASLGITATELGAPGFLPDDGAALRARWSATGSRSSAASCPSSRTSRRTPPRRCARPRARCRARRDVISLALVQDMAWSAPRELTEREWATLVATVAELEAVAPRRASRSHCILTRGR